MPTIKYECRNCKREFEVRYSFLKPNEVRCPHCGSNNTAEAGKKPACGYNTKDNFRSWFT